MQVNVSTCDHLSEMAVAALDTIAAASFAVADVDGDNVLTRTCSACGKGGDGEDCPVFPRLWEFLPGNCSIKDSFITQDRNENFERWIR